jgi:hypothetical protein
MLFDRTECFLLSIIFLIFAAILSHDYHHADAHHDTLPYCVPLFALHDAVSHTVAAVPVYDVVNYVCGDF